MYKNHPVYLIAACDEENGIGKNNRLPWHLGSDMQHFTKTTSTATSGLRNAVIMGRTTWESIPENHKPLKARVNIVVTRQLNYHAKAAIVASSLEDALAKAHQHGEVETIFNIGGAQMYALGLANQCTDGIYLTRVHGKFDCDAFFPDIPKNFQEETLLGSVTEKKISLDFLLLEKL